MPFAGFSDFDSCLKAQQSKGEDIESSKKICGKLQSETKGANEPEALLSGAISRSECEQKAKNMGHSDPDEIKRICDAVPTNGKKKSAKVSPDDPIFDHLSKEERIMSAVAYNDCLDQAKEYGHDEPTSHKICGHIAMGFGGYPINNESPSQEAQEESLESDDGSQPDNEGAEEQEETSSMTNPGSGNIAGPSSMGAVIVDDGENDTNKEPDTHNYDTQGPAFDNLGADEADKEDEPDTYSPDNSSLDDNDHINNQEGGQDDMADNLGDDNNDSNDNGDIDVEQILSDIDKLLGGNLQLQNQFTDPGKLDNYLDQEAIDWSSDEEADYNEKSDTKKIDLSYYDDDINKCVDEQVKNGLSQENARSFCNNLANYNGDGDIKADDELSPVNYQNREYVEGSDTGSHTATYNENDIKLLEAFFIRDDNETEDGTTPSQLGRDTTNGGKDLDTGKYVTGHGPNSLKANPHKHDMGNDGPTYDHFGNDINDADTVAPDAYQADHNSNLDDNDHITRHMSSEQKQMAEQNLEQVPQEDDNESMQGLGMNSVGNIVNKGPSQAFNNGINEFTAKPETVGSAPEGAAIKKAWNESVAKEAIDATNKLNKVLNASTEMPAGIDVTKETVKWIKNGAIYSGSQCIQDFGGDNDAKDVCQYIAKHYDGSYDHYMAAMQITPFEQNNKLFVKAFLMDPSLNLNKWGVSPTTLDANIRSYIGKPLVLQKDFDHPVSADDNLQHQLEYQELFRVGTIIDVINKNGKYDAIAEVTDPYAQKAFREGNLPLYVSPQLYKLDANEADSQMTKWTGTHLAIVKEPAYTIKRATINGECTGESDKCLAYLKKAAIIKEHGYGNCGYCNYKVLRSAQVTTTNDINAIDVSNSPTTKKKKKVDDEPKKEAATIPDKPPQINHSQWVKHMHTKEENDEYERSLQATIEEDKRFIEEMETFLNV